MKNIIKKGLYATALSSMLIPYGSTANIKNNPVNVQNKNLEAITPVSYTHLTLPTN